MTIIVAKNKQSAQHVARERGLKHREWHYVGLPAAARGVLYDTLIVVDGAAGHRQHAEIMHSLRFSAQHGARTIHVTEVGADRKEQRT